MATVDTFPQDAFPQDAPALGSLAKKIFRFDSVLSLLAAMLVIVGIAVLFLGSAWVSNQVWSSGPPIVPAAEFVNLGPPRDAGEEGVSGDDPAGGDGTGDVEDPGDAAPGEENLAFDATGVANVMSSIVDAVGDQGADLDAPVLTSGRRSRGKGGGGGGTGKRGTGLGGGGASEPNERWTVIYNEQQTIDMYARQLDFFGIELGVVRGTSLTSVSAMSARKATVKANAAHDNRLYFQWRDIGRRKADAELLKNKAGINVDNANIVHFYPKRVEDMMTALEKQYKGRDAKDIRLTTFAVRKQGQGFEMYVVAQSYLKG